jgi:hypothetical protein
MLKTSTHTTQTSNWEVKRGRRNETAHRTIVFLNNTLRILSDFCRRHIALKGLTTFMQLNSDLVIELAFPLSLYNNNDDSQAFQEI